MRSYSATKNAVALFDGGGGRIRSIAQYSTGSPRASALLGHFLVKNVISAREKSEIWY